MLVFVGIIAVIIFNINSLTGISDALKILLLYFSNIGFDVCVF